MHRPLGKWAPRRNIPQTDALIGQKKASMTHLQNWWFNKLEEEDLEVFAEDQDWEKGPVQVLASDFFESYAAYFHQHKRGGEGLMAKPAFNKGMARLLKKDVWKPYKGYVSKERQAELGLLDKRPYVYDIPSLDECKDAFGRALME